MDIVRGRVAVHHIQLLVGLQSNHVRLVLAAFLLDNGGLLRRFKCSIAQAISDIYNDICQPVVGADHHILGGCGSGVCFGTVRIG
jgi:hypothetical protein